MASIVEVESAVAVAAREGLLREQKSLPPWLFYDEAGSQLFEQITVLPEYYLTRTERGILAASAETILRQMDGPVTLVELGAGTATKTGLLLGAAARMQGRVLYQPIDVSASALDEACAWIEAELPEVSVRPKVANYVTERIRVERPAGMKVLALSIGSSIGNFSPGEARGILENLRAELQPGDGLLLGTDLGPGKNKSVARLVAAYDDAQGVTAAFNRNILARLNRELGTSFNLDCFRHVARWNGVESRMEMHLEALTPQTVDVGGREVAFAKGETIHTENSYKFGAGSVGGLLEGAGFAAAERFTDAEELFAVTLAVAVAV